MKTPHGILMLILAAAPLVAGQTGANPATQSTALAEADQLDAQIGSLYKQQQFDKAIPLAQKELTLREDALGPNHPAVADVSRNLAELFLAKGKYKEANLAYRRYLQIYEGAFGSDSPKLIDGLYRYVSMLLSENQKPEALEIEKRVFRLENGFDFDQLSIQKNKNLMLSGLMSGMQTIAPTPVYAQEARNGGVAGAVVIKLTLDEKAQISELNILSGHPLLNSAAEQAARRATYAPASLAGAPRKVTGILVYFFGMNYESSRTDSIQRITGPSPCRPTQGVTCP